jgi:hypothetical protein
MQELRKLVNQETPVIGLKWEVLGEDMPEVGKEIKNRWLAEMLKDKREFDRSEFDKLGLPDLTKFNYIKSGDCYFRPVSTRPDIEFALDKVLVALHNHAGNVAITRHACALLVDFITPIQAVIVDGGRTRTPGLPLGSIFTSQKQARSLGSREGQSVVSAKDEEDEVQLDHLQVALNKGWKEDDDSSRPHEPPVQIQLLRRALSQVLLAMELHGENRSVRRYAQAFVDLVFSFDSSEDSFADLNRRRHRIEKASEPQEQSKEAPCKNCFSLQKPCKNCFFRWFMEKHQVSVCARGRAFTFLSHKV